MTKYLPSAPWEGACVREKNDELVGLPPHVRKLIIKTFQGKPDAGDLQYMARAILELSDKYFELTERIRGIEDGLRYRENPPHNPLDPSEDMG